MQAADQAKRAELGAPHIHVYSSLLARPLSQRNFVPPPGTEAVSLLQRLTMWLCREIWKVDGIVLHRLALHVNWRVLFWEAGACFRGAGTQRAIMVMAKNARRTAEANANLLGPSRWRPCGEK